IYRYSLVDASNRGYMPIDSWPADGPEVRSLWGRARDDVWAAGDDVGRWDGTKWSRVADAPAGARAPQNGGGTLVTGDAGAVWLIARGPHFFRFGTAVTP